MSKAIVNTTIVLVMLCTLILSCQTTSSDDVADFSSTEQYFEGKLSYTLTSAFFEESISGIIIPVDMTGLNYMIDTEFPQINDKIGIPTYVNISGYLASQPNEEGELETHLTIRRIEEMSSDKRRIQPMTGTYSGNGQTLTIAPNHTYTLQSRNSNRTEGNWFLHSENTIVLLSGSSKTVMNINYKKKSLNGKDDNPIIFTFSPTLSNH